MIAGEAPTGAVGDEPNSGERQAPDPDPQQTADEATAGEPGSRRRTPALTRLT